jgi:hypothetical protein
VLEGVGLLVLSLLAYEFKKTWRHIFEIGWRSLPMTLFFDRSELQVVNATSR